MRRQCKGPVGLMVGSDRKGTNIYEQRSLLSAHSCPRLARLLSIQDHGIQAGRCWNPPSVNICPRDVDDRT